MGRLLAARVGWILHSLTNSEADTAAGNATNAAAGAANAAGAAAPGSAPVALTLADIDANRLLRWLFSNANDEQAVPAPAARGTRQHLL